MTQQTARRLDPPSACRATPTTPAAISATKRSPCCARSSSRAPSTAPRARRSRPFERDFASALGVPHARAVTSGTAAMPHRSRGDRPRARRRDHHHRRSPTWARSRRSCTSSAIPVFADVDPVSLQRHRRRRSRSASRTRTRAIIATHLFGNPCDIDRHSASSPTARGIPVIEDCAQAFLATQDATAGRHDRRDRRLQPAAGQAHDDRRGRHRRDSGRRRYARWMTLFSDKAWGYGDPKPDHYFLALNYRMTDLQGAVARAQLAKLEASSRGASAVRQICYRADSPACRGSRLPSALPGATHVYWKYPLIVDPARDRRRGADALGAPTESRRRLLCAALHPEARLRVSGPAASARRTE